MILNIITGNKIIRAERPI